MYGLKRLLVRMNDGTSRVSFDGTCIVPEGTSHPRLVTGRGNADVCVSGTFACHAEKGVEETKRDGEKGVGQLSAGRNFKFEHPLSIKSVPLPEGTASMPCCSYTNFINHASQHTGGGGYPAGSLCPSYIFAHEIRPREILRRPMIGGCNDRYE